MRGKVTRQSPQTTTFEEKGETKRNRTEVLLLTSLTSHRQAKPAHNRLCVFASYTDIYITCSSPTLQTVPPLFPDFIPPSLLLSHPSIPASSSSPTVPPLYPMSFVLLSYCPTPLPDVIHPPLLLSHPSTPASSSSPTVPPLYPISFVLPSYCPTPLPDVLRPPTVPPLYPASSSSPTVPPIYPASSSSPTVPSLYPMSFVLLSYCPIPLPRPHPPLLLSHPSTRYHSSSPPTVRPLYPMSFVLLLSHPSTRPHPPLLLSHPSTRPHPPLLLSHPSTRCPSSSSPTVPPLYLDVYPFSKKH